MKQWWKYSRRINGSALLFITIGIAVFCVLAIARGGKALRTDRPLNASEAAAVAAAIDLMRSKGLTGEADLAVQIDKKAIWRAASPNDPYIKQSEQERNTPFAYTLSNSRQPDAIVLAPRFFTETTSAARAALMIHEMGHYAAYVKSGHSDEFDGYKAEYDTHKQLGLDETDGLTYFSMLDGAVEYVVPRLPVYKTYPDIKAYMDDDSGG